MAWLSGSLKCFLICLHQSLILREWMSPIYMIRLSSLFHHFAASPQRQVSRFYVSFAMSLDRAATRSLFVKAYAEW
jgi:hypothetical protein